MTGAMTDGLGTVTNSVRERTGKGSRHAPV